MPVDSAMESLLANPEKYNYVHNEKYKQETGVLLEEHQVE